jgi:hypothetical protein
VVTEQDVDANNKYLLVIRPNTKHTKLQRAILRARSTVDFEYAIPLSWLVVGKLKGAQIIDGDLRLGEVQTIRGLGVASRATLKAPMIAYILLLLVGVLTLSVPIRVLLRMGTRRDLALTEIKSYIKMQYQNNPANTPADCAQKAVCVDGAPSFHKIIECFSQH